jgi:hypothetical protein
VVVSAEGEVRLTVPLERGFRRLVFVLSVALLGLGVVLDLSMGHFSSIATYRVQVGDETYQIESPASATNDQVWDKAWRQTPMTGQLERDLPVKTPETVTIVRGPTYWLWRRVVVEGATGLAAALVVMAWVGFYAARWIARGFARA